MPTLASHHTAPGTITAAPSSAESRARRAGLWTAQIIVAAMFLFAGTLKLTGAPDMVTVFDTIGIGQWFRYLTGAIEVVSAVLLLVPRLAVFGALPLIPTMIGAILAHVFVLGGSPAVPILLLAASGLIAWGRRRQLAGIIWKNR